MLTIRRKLISAFLIIALLPVLIVATITSHNVIGQAESDFIQTSSADIAIVDQSFTNFFDIVSYNVSFLADTAIVRATEKGDISTYFDEARKPSQVAMANGGREQEIFELFSAVGNNNPTLGYVYMGAKNGQYLEWPGTADYENWDPRTEPWFDLGKAGNFQVQRIDGYYWEPDDAVYVSVLKAFKDEQEQFAGVVAIDVSVKALTEMVQKIKFGDTGFIMIVEGRGNILVDASNPENTFKSLNELNAPYLKTIAATDSGAVEVNIDGITYMANIVKSDTLGWKFIGFKQTDEIFSSASQLIWVTVIVSSLLIALFIVLGIWFAKHIVDPINEVKDELKTLAEGEGNLTTRLNIKGKDETSQLASWFNQFISTTQAMISEIKYDAEKINNISGSASESAVKVADSSNQQMIAIEQVVTAVTEMASTANEVAKNCADTADVSQQGLEASQNGKQVMNTSINSVKQLGESIRTSNQVIQELEQETENINNILVTIQGIAEQTNLLALNAAIEAARAGEQGRGFAVVADEVRNLAKRTQDSTGEINNILGQLTERTKTVSTNMETSLSQSHEAIAISEEVRTVFDNIENSVQEIRDMTTQIASAAEEQHQVTEDINVNVVAINDAASDMSALSSEVENNAREQAELGENLSALVSNFKTN
ncbi:methyl-accepting chemotaxis protein [Thalassomonas actiniarum]|uniref:Methyl-accepting chemotaxis protein n=1 Tax=Thalassomonas actiniarum TaxID=485447 RepID=A0AAE9YN83_9GAMM|nr:methyl-accepting chemotaxis protein [Thalassomonas actiniarum]WDD97827.1 methyl-accepting chemotaxis protein [Thalassomonas actiniarum]